MSTKYPPVAIIGVSALFPGSTDARGFWRDILAGKDLLTEVPETHWLIEDFFDPDPAAADKVYCRRGGFLQDVPFSAMEFGVPPNNVPATDTSQLLSLIVARRVIEDATQGNADRLRRDRVSVILGVASTTELTAHMAGRLQRPLWIRALRTSGLPDATIDEIDRRFASLYVPWQESTFPGLLANVVAGRISNQLDLGGTNCVIDAACASSLAALSTGLNELYLGQADVVIAGGVDTLNDILMFMCFARTTALSTTEDCRPFSDRADGTMLGEGIGMFALKRLEDAERDGDQIYAVIRGVGSSSDGYAKSIYAPRAEGQAAALRRAYEHAGYGPETVELVEAHGTATKAGDAAEFSGLRMVFDGTSSKRQWCALGSVKSQIGHTKAAAGAAGLFKIVMALHHKVLPPTIKVETPNPDLHLEDSPFYLNTRVRPWISSGDHPRRASVSSFGFGGTNFHVAVEEYTGSNQAARSRSLPAELVLFSAADPAALVQRCRASISETFVLQTLARTSQRAFKSSDRVRLAIVAADEEGMRRKIEQAAAMISRQPERPFATPDGVSYGCGEEPGGIAFLFPGQGSQYVEMGSDLAIHFEPVRRLWDRVASLRLAPDSGLHEIVFPPPAFTDAARQEQNERLTRTEWAQPSIGVMSAGLLSIMRSLDIKPACLGGHSFGEITALYAAGALDESSFVRVARTRGELMARAPGIPGAMTAVSSPRDTLRALMEKWDLDVVMANCNSPRQTVLSGPVAAIEVAEQRLKAAGLAARRLNVATAFHSRLVHEASRSFEQFLDDVPFEEPAQAVFANTDARPYPKTAAEIRRRLASQMASPVLFEQEIAAMYDAGVRTFIEVGPGAALSGLIDECLDGEPHLAQPLDRRGKDGVTALFEALGRLAVRGLPVAFEALWAGETIEAPRRQEGKTEAPRFTIPIRGSNHGKPYPSVLKSAAPIPQPRTESQPAAPVNSDEHLAWIDAYQKMQQQTVEAQAAFQRMMTESHLAFLKASEQSLAQLTNQLSGYAPQASAQPFVIPVPAPVPHHPESVAVPAKEPQVERPQPSADMAALLLAVVSEKTGYPVEMLDLSMVMESDLGIDSIKRVQILSAIQDRVPDLPEIETSQLAGLRTLGEVLAYMNREAGGGAVSVPSNSDMAALLLEVVSEKTGYPVEMLDLAMVMESDLGIDSIKRVQILSAIQDRVPDLPEIETSQLAGLRTLGEVLAHMKRGGSGSAQVANETPHQPASNISGATERYVLQSVSTPRTGFGLPGLRTGRIAITDDGAGIASALAHRLKSCGLQAAVVDVIPEDARSVIFLGSLKSVDTIDAALAINREAFAVVKTIAQRFQESGGDFVTVQDTGGAWGLSGPIGIRAWMAGVGALAKTAKLEWPRAAVKAIDIDCGPRSSVEVAGAIAEELMAGGPEVEVGLSAAGLRSVPRCIEAPTDAREFPFDRESVIVASGGARGVTAAALIELAKRTPARFVLLGRSTLEPEPACYEGVKDNSDLKRIALAEAQKHGRKLSPKELDLEISRILASREIRSTLEGFRAIGAAARYVSVDVRDATALAESFDSIRKDWGPITAVVHGAGVLADALIAHKTAAQFERVFTTKVDGLRGLLQATAQDPLRLICLFSSVAARYGNAGQCDYAMANEILNKVAQSEAAKRGPSVQVKSINWGPWESGMVTPELREHFAERGVALMSLAGGARRFVEEIESNRRGETEVIIGSGLNPGAAGMLGVSAASDAATAVDVIVNAATYPHLNSHRIQGVPTLPVVQVIEWFVRLAKACAPAWSFKSCRDVKVLKGVLLHGFDKSVDERFIVRCNPVSNGSSLVMRLELQGPDNTRHYEAEIEMIPAGNPAANGHFEHAHLQLESSPWAPAQLYSRELLFHGRDFQVIRAVQGISRDGIAAVVNGTQAMGWHGGPWRTDPAAIDGGLQLMLLWSAQYLDRQCLPLAIGEYVQYAEPAPDTPLQCVVRTNKSSQLNASFDMLLTAPDDQPVARLSDVQMYVVPGGTA